MADNNRLQCFACSLSLPGGKPIDLQFILTNAKSMQRDMKSPRFLRLHSRFLKRFVTADNGNLPCLWLCTEQSIW